MTIPEGAMSEYDQRQYRLMRGLLEKFEQNKISMRRATGDLGTLLDFLEEKDEAWEALFDSFWKDMQYESEMASYSGVESKKALRRARDAAAKLKEVMAQKIEEPSDEI